MVRADGTVGAARPAPCEEGVRVIGVGSGRGRRRGARADETVLRFAEGIVPPPVRRSLRRGDASDDDAAEIPRTRRQRFQKSRRRERRSIGKEERSGQRSKTVWAVPKLDVQNACLPIWYSDHGSCTVSPIVAIRYSAASLLSHLRQRCAAVTPWPNQQHNRQQYQHIRNNIEKHKYTSTYAI